MEQHKVVVSQGAYRELLVALRGITPHLAVLLDGSISLLCAIPASSDVSVTCEEIEAILGPSAPVPPVRDTSPELHEAVEVALNHQAKELGGWPSELCGKILSTLESEFRRFRKGMTPAEIGKVAKVAHGAGQVSGATSNMVNKKGRHWIEQRSGLWYLTYRGRHMLELMKETNRG